ncbi:hypothetical protein [Moorena sp. SIO3H5]|uniref:hypothetical protein n=1 Tax=Moorena sp. SIO3H5 TaxID=2607834 RepID=UPI0013BE8A0E|nr:hypothetical protein [Moorena sp. SIO3H5]NEO69751.1 hypothetical protein [Moorena sp. SIO3H5]
MADYTQYPYIDKRVRYFDGEFLKDQDFIDEQKYHIDRQRRLDQFLRVSGICDGFTLDTATNQVIVKPGTALDTQGRQIILSTNSPPIDLSAHNNNEVYLVISYQEEQSDQTTDGSLGSSGARRWHENPNIQVATLENLPEDSIILAKLAIDGNGTVTPDLSVRQYSGVRLPSGNLDSGAITGPTLRSGGNSASSLVVIEGDLNVTGDTTVNGSLSFSSNVSGERPLLMEAPNSNNHRGDGTQEATGLVYRVQTNPNAGEPIFQVRSSGEAVRLFVEHDGWTGSQHNSAWFGGTDRANYFAGNVGIGINPAEEPLHIHSAAGQGLKIAAADKTSIIKLHVASGDYGFLCLEGSNGDTVLRGGDDHTSSFSGDLSVGGTLTVTGGTTLNNLTIDDSATLSFQNNTRQMINLWNQSYGIGIQSHTQYFRTATNFAWYKGGSHHDNELNAGSSGTVQMVIKDGNVGIGTADPGSSKLKVQGNLTVTGSLSASSNVSGERTLLMEPPKDGNHRGDGGTQGATGLVYRVEENPSEGEPIFQVRSSGEAVRLFVEHDGWTGSQHNSAWFGGTRDNYFAGKVGIGINPAEEPLHINSAAGQGLRISANDKTSLIKLHVASNDYGYLHLGGSNEATVLRGGDDHTSSFSGDLSVGGTLTVTGDTTLNSNLSVAGALTVTGGTTLNGNLTVTGSFSASSNVSGERTLLMEAPNDGNHRGDDGTQGATGLVYRVEENPNAGEPIFQVRSSGEAVRLFVEHDGWTGSQHNSAWFGGTRDNYFAGNLGIGTTDPGSYKLKVEGNTFLNGKVQLGSGGTNFQRVIAGRVNSNGTKASGSGFSSTRTGKGTYTVTFSPAFSSTPVVVANCSDEADDNLINIKVSSSSAIFYMTDASPNNNAEKEDGSFNFVAFGLG